MAELLIEGQNITSSDPSWTGYYINDSDHTDLIFRNNAITSVNTSGYLLCAGDEGPSATNNHLDGAIITGNKFTWNGTPGSPITHGEFNGYNINQVIKWNYLDKCPYGIIYKSGTDAGVNMSNTAGGSSYNIIRNGKFCIRSKGFDGVCVYNNTFYVGSGFGTLGLIYMTPNDDRSIPKEPLGWKIKNNIFYAVDSSVMMINIQDADTLDNFECDYNIYWNEGYTNNEPRFNVGGTTYSWTQWKALGYDAHSYVVNPDFNNVTDLLPSSRLNYGADLGSSYNTGLSTTATWSVGTAPGTQAQNGSWQVGARIYAATPSTPSPTPSLSVTNTRTPSPTPSISISKTPGLSPSPASMGTYYVATTGLDEAGRNGSIGQEWASLSYAASRVTTSGSVIYVNSGNYTDNNRVTLSLGVSIQGNSASPPNITAGYVASSGSDGYILMNTSQGNAVDGSHTISYVNFDGNLTATRAITNNYRSNVVIHHCNFTDFVNSGVILRGCNNWDTTPTNTLPTGNKVYNCNFDNCTQLTGSDYSTMHLRFEGQNGAEAYNCTFIQTGRTAGENTDITGGYQNRGLKIHNCIFTKDDTNGDEWNFFAEFHYSNGGFELYDNIFNGAAEWDASGNEDLYGYGFGLKIYRNTFQTSGPPPIDSGDKRQSYIDLESFTVADDIYIYQNYFKYSRIGISYNNIKISSDNVWIYDNIFENVGNSDDLYSYALQIGSDWGEKSGRTFSNIHILNNVIDCGASAYAGIITTAAGNINNFDIKNNIINGNFSYPIRFNTRSGFTPTITNLLINNNITYGGGTTDIVYSNETTYTNRNDDDNLFNTDPGFGSNFHLATTGSSAYHAGVYVGLSIDYEGNLWNNPPSIGAIEYDADSPPTPTPSHAECDEISILDIALKTRPTYPFPTTNLSLRFNAVIAGFVTPDAFSEFCGWEIPVTPTPSTSPWPVAYGINTTSYNSWSDACSAEPTPNLSIYLTAGDIEPTVGDNFYLDQALTNPFVGNSEWYFIRRMSDEWTCRIDSYGDILEVVNCLAPPTPSSTPSLSLSATQTPSLSISPTRTPTPTVTPTTPLGSFGIHTGTTYNSWSDACYYEPTPQMTVYTTAGDYYPTVGDHLYTDTNLSIGFTGQLNKYYFIRGFNGVWSIMISNDGTGHILEVIDCYNPPSPSPTPTLTPTVTPSLSVSATRTPSTTVTPSVTKTPSRTPTPSPFPVAWGFHTAHQYNESTAACTDGFTPDSTKYTLYGNDPIEIGDYIYNNQACTESFNGGSYYYYVLKGVDYYAIKVRNDGYVEDVVDCDNMPTPSPTRTPSLSISKTPTSTPSLSLSRTPSLSISITPSITPSTSPWPVSYGIHTANTYSTSDQACVAAPTPDSTKYLTAGDNTPSVNDVFYNDQGLTEPFSGNGNWYFVRSFSETFACKINSSGVITDVTNCSEMPTPSPTPTITPTRTPSLSVSPSSGQAPCASGLYGWWKLDESSGNAADSSGNGYTGTASNITYTASGKVSRCFTFNGSNSKVVLGNIIKPTSALSFSIWTKDGGQSTERHVIGHTIYTTAWKGWRFTRYNDNAAGVLLTDGAGQFLDVAFGNNYSNDAWHHTVFTWNGTTAYVYKDGSKSTLGTWSYTIGYGTTHNLTFGANDSGGQVYDGEIDEVGIWNRALTDAEAAYLYNGGSGRSCFTETSPSPTPSISTSSGTPSVTPTRTKTPSITPSPTITGSPDPSMIPQGTPSRTPSITPSITPSRTPSISVSRTRTPSMTPSRTATRTPSVTPSRTATGVAIGIYAGTTFTSACGASSACAASNSPDGTVYMLAGHSVPENTHTFYTNEACTTTYTGNGNYYRIYANSVWYAVQISSTGVQSNVTLCSNCPSSSPTPSRTPSRTPTKAITYYSYDVTVYDSGCSEVTTIGIDTTSALSAGKFYCYFGDVYRIDSPSSWNNNVVSLSGSGYSTCSVARLNC